MVSNYLQLFSEINGKYEYGGKRIKFYDQLKSFATEFIKIMYIVK